jgi:hypothetical protein
VQTGLRILLCWRNCECRLVYVSCSAGFTTLNGGGLCLAEHALSSHSCKTSTVSFLGTAVCKKSQSSGKYKCPLTVNTYYDDYHNL